MTICPWGNTYYPCRVLSRPQALLVVAMETLGQTNQPSMTTGAISAVSNKRNRAFWENSALWVFLSLCLVAKGKGGAKSYIESFALCNVYALYNVYLEILMSKNSSIAIFPYSHEQCRKSLFSD